MQGYGKNEEIFGAETLHRGIGYYISRLEQYAKSLPYFDKAVQHTPDDLRALIGRSRARAKAIQYEGALEDINHALSLHPDELVLQAEKALDTYLCCEFEEGLVHNLRHVPIRQKPEVFSMGVMNCTVAIENCIGERTGRPLRDHFKIIRNIAWRRNSEAQKPFEPKPIVRSKKKKFRLLKSIQPEHNHEPVQPKKAKMKKNLTSRDIAESLHSVIGSQEKIPPYNQRFPFKPLQNYTTNIQNYMAEKYLDKMYLDKIFLKQIQDEPGMDSPNKKGASKLRNIVKNCHKTVSYKQELLRTRRPFYFIKYQEARVSGVLKERQKLELAHQQQMTKKETDVLLQKMLKAFTEKRLRDFLDLTEKLKRYCDSKSRKLLPNKADYMAVIYDTVCKAFYELYRVNENQSMYEQNKRIYATLGIPLSREPSKDSVVAQTKSKFTDYKRQIMEFENRLKEAVLSEEICWFYHELARLHLDHRQFDMARLYAKKCIQEATLVDNDRWILNCAMLLCKSNVQQHNKNDAKIDLQLAVKSAERLKDEAKISYLKKCIEVVDSMQLDEMFGDKELLRRENMIIKMMSSSRMKDEVAHLFRQMAAMPTTRRMTVMPGVKIAQKDQKGLKGRAMSIMPQSRDSTRINDVRRASKGMNKEGRTTSLIDLIEF